MPRAPCPGGLSCLSEVCGSTITPVPFFYGPAPGLVLPKSGRSAPALQRGVRVAPGGDGGGCATMHCVHVALGVQGSRPLFPGIVCLTCCTRVAILAWWAPRRGALPGALPACSCRVHCMMLLVSSIDMRHPLCQVYRIASATGASVARPAQPPMPAAAPARAAALPSALLQLCTPVESYLGSPLRAQNGWTCTRRRCQRRGSHRPCGLGPPDVRRGDRPAPAGLAGHAGGNAQPANQLRWPSASGHGPCSQPCEHMNRAAGADAPVPQPPQHALPPHHESSSPRRSKTLTAISLQRVAWRSTARTPFHPWGSPRC